MGKQDIRSKIQDIWKKNERGYHPLELALRGASCLYALSIKVRNCLYDKKVFPQKRLSCKVISVGNIVVGGTGKTPMVIYLANLLREKGFRPAVLSRGYMGKSKSPVNIVSDGHRLFMKPDDCGDEPVLISQAAKGIPVLTGSKRFFTGQIALEKFGVNVLILDDGFQHRQLARDIDIVLLQGEAPLGNGCLLPAGPLRESSRALNRADLIFYVGDNHQNHVESKPAFQVFHKGDVLLNGATQQEYALDHLRGRRICAFAGIGSPERFQKTLTDAGAQIVFFASFPDHHFYTHEEIRNLQKRAAEENVEMIVTTEKDGVKLKPFHLFLEKIHFLRVSMAFVSEEEKFISSLLDRLQDSHT
ncbi:MAG: tetraacyldisaccharide 4'-kinase [Syntrophobacterales bacterium]|jgi:tetraacyldisaccharide 4'-kinase|nr:tetraacyldisaccharide 4'-kinase [Syntrophobacterales bacterium]